MSIIGSLASMEIIKLITCKFIPIKQWMVYHDTSIVPDEKPDLIDSKGLGNLFGQKTIPTTNI